MAEGVSVFDSAVRKKNSVFSLVIRLFTYVSIDGSFPLCPILRMHALRPFFPGRQALFLIKAIYAIPLLGEMHGVSSRYPPGPTPRMRKPLRFRQETFAPPQRFFGPLAFGDIHHSAHEFEVARFIVGRWMTHDSNVLHGAI